MTQSKISDLFHILSARDRFLDSDVRLGDALQECVRDAARGRKRSLEALHLQEAAYFVYRQTVRRALGIVSHSRRDRAGDEALTRSPRSNKGPLGSNPAGRTGGCHGR